MPKATMASASTQDQPEHGTPGADPVAAPVFRPTVQEFKDPIAYLASIRDKAEPFGICKIVPPAGWRPTFAINKDKCTLPTRIQALHMLQHTSANIEALQQAPDNKRFMADYKAWLTRRGGSFKKAPQLYGQDIDLAALHTAVAKRGGFQACCDAGAWRTVARALQVRVMALRRRFFIALPFRSSAHNMPHRSRTAEVMLPHSCVRSTARRCSSMTKQAGPRQRHQRRSKAHRPPHSLGTWPPVLTPQLPTAKHAARCVALGLPR